MGIFNGVVRSHFMSITVNDAKELRKFSGHQYTYCNRHLQSNGKQNYYNHQAPEKWSDIQPEIIAATVNH